MIILSTVLNKEDCLFISAEIKLLTAINEGKAVEGLKEFLKTIVDLAEKGQVESMEYYYRLLPPFIALEKEQPKLLKFYEEFSPLETGLEQIESSAMLSKNIFKNITKFTRNSKKEPRDNMALYAFFLWQAKQNLVAGNYIALEPIIKNSPNYLKANENFENAISQLKRHQRYDSLIKEYFYEMQTLQNDKNTASFQTEMSNFRNKLAIQISQQTSFEKRYKLYYAYLKNTLIFLMGNEPRGISDHLKTEINNFLIDSQNAAFIQIAKNI